MRKKILLSVKPWFAEAILAGKKRFEFRRALFSSREVKTVVLYASSPTRQVVGEFTIAQVLTLELEALWNSTVDGGAIDREYFDRYFDGLSTGHALEVKRVKRYDTPLCLLRDFGLERPPQSFCYID